jgi:hypothetical protein
VQDVRPSLTPEPTPDVCLLAGRLLFHVAQRTSQHHLVVTEAPLQFTIESRELTSHSTPSRAAHVEPTSMTIDADNPDDAITAFVRQNDSELVSFQKPAECRESIATVRKDDVVFLVRVYAA